MKRLTLLALLGLHSACSMQAVHTPALTSGLEHTAFDTTVRPQDDFYHYINGQWLNTTTIPADKARFGTFQALTDRTEQQLLDIITELANSTNSHDNDAQKLHDLYTSFMNETVLEQLGIKPLKPTLKRIDALHSVRAMPQLLAHLSTLGVAVPYLPSVHQDNRDATRYIIDLYQAGLGLPDRDYYLTDGSDGGYKKIRAAYQLHIEKLLVLSGDRKAKRHARMIFKLETALAQAQWDKVTNRDPVKTYNKYKLTELSTLIPGYNWSDYLQALQVDAPVTELLISQPSYFAAFGKLLRKRPLAEWKLYLKWRVLSHYAAYLSSGFVAQRFDFYGKELRGIPENAPRWKRGINVLQQSMGESLGKLYVSRFFPAEHKHRIETLVNNLRAAYQQSIAELDWMTPATKQAAQTKLAKLNAKLGYPDQWRDYSALDIQANDLVGNIMRSQRFELHREIKKLGQPVDRTEWFMTPQMVNAYYSSELNEVVFPAALLQPPFFNAAADDAINYGAIGAIIGHEISHGFDDHGRQYDGDGNLRDWWTETDQANFIAKTKQLIEQYSAYEPVPGYRLNGSLTLGENIADNTGLAIAYKAYRLSLKGHKARIIDGLTGDQRFFAGWAQAWRAKSRPAETIRLVTIDPHAPPEFRVWGALVNQDAFYKAFDVQPNDKMYLPPSQRVTIW